VNLARRRPWLARVAAVTVVAAAAACARNADVEPPATLSPQTVAGAPIGIDSVALIRDVAVLAHDSMQGRAVATPGSAKARAYLEPRFRAAGLQPIGTSFLQPFTFSGGGRQIQGVNIVGQLRGTALPERYFVITAHYDHVGVRNGQVFNGADDNASGIAALLALADHFRKNPPRHSLIFGALDAEETGLAGARAFVASPPVPKQNIVLNINMDMVSRNDQGELYVAGTHSYPQLLPFVQRAVAAAEVKLIPGHDRPVFPASTTGPDCPTTARSTPPAFRSSTSASKTTPITTALLMTSSASSPGSIFAPCARSSTRREFSTPD